MEILHVWEAEINSEKVLMACDSGQGVGRPALTPERPVCFTEQQSSYREGVSRRVFSNLKARRRTTQQLSVFCSCASIVVSVHFPKNTAKSWGRKSSSPAAFGVLT